jgi:hypothetical protein
MSKLSRTCISIMLACAFLGSGCDGDEDDLGVAGQKEQPSTNTEVVLVEGAMGAPDAPREEGWSAQEAADTLYQRGLAYDNGVSHQPTWVQCTGDSQNEISPGTYRGFYCRIQVPDLALYDIYLTIGSSDLRFAFLKWVQ